MQIFCFVAEISSLLQNTMCIKQKGIPFTKQLFNALKNQQSKTNGSCLLCCLCYVSSFTTNFEFVVKIKCLNSKRHFILTKLNVLFYINLIINPYDILNINKIINRLAGKHNFNFSYQMTNHTFSFHSFIDIRGTNNSQHHNGMWKERNFSLN